VVESAGLLIQNDLFVTLREQGQNPRQSSRKPHFTKNNQVVIKAQLHALSVLHFVARNTITLLALDTFKFCQAKTLKSHG
jgi:hypothetical protein